MKQKNKKAKFFSVLLGIFGTSLLQNLFIGEDKIRAASVTIIAGD